MKCWLLVFILKIPRMMICRLEKKTDVIAVTLTPSCYCSGESWCRSAWVGSSWYPALLLILLNWDNRMCSFLLRRSEMLSSGPPLILKPRMFSNGQMMLKCCWLLVAPSLAVPQLVFWSCDMYCRGPSVISPLICQNLIHYSSGFFHRSSNICRFPTDIW